MCIRDRFFLALACAQTLHFLTRRQQWARPIAIVLAVVVLALDRDVHGAAYGSLWLLLGAEVARRKLLDDASGSPQQAGLSVVGYLTAGAACYVLGVPYTLAIPACAFALHALYCVGQSRADWPAALTGIGKATLPIYVMHVLVVAGLRIALLKGLQVQPSAMLVVVLTLAGIALPIAAVTLLRRLGVSKWLLLD